MAKFEKKLEFANYTLLFGTDYKLLDKFEDIVWPSFNSNLIRAKEGVGQFFFMDTHVIEVNNELAIVGKFVKKQYYKEIKFMIKVQIS